MTEHKRDTALIESFHNKQRRALAQLITRIEQRRDASTILSAVGGTENKALKIGITGSGGAGKSTLISALIRHLRQAGKRVAVLACDPSSVLTGGALLGDRVRMNGEIDDGVFIRSIATRGATGGLSTKTGPIMSLLERFGFDVILVETIGVGQDQAAVRPLVDVLVLMVTPAGGDEIQWQKAGLIEIADVLVVNKADLPGADQVVADLKTTSAASDATRGGRSRTVLKTAATSAEGVREIWDAIELIRPPESADASSGVPPMSNVAVAAPQKEKKLGLSRFDLHAERGYLPDNDPLERLPEAFAAWEQLAADLPKLLVSHSVRGHVQAMPLLDMARLNDREARRAMALLSFVGHAYVWGEDDVVDRIPAPLAVPWHAVAQRLGRPPVLSYASYALDNWLRIDPAGPIALGNIALLQNFLGGIDEEWFVLVHVEIEREAAPALRSLLPAQAAVAADRPDELARCLTTVADSIHEMHQTLTRMPEHCDPYIYFHRVRPYIHGWKGHPALPNGLVYEGVVAYGGQPQLFRGETGAQSGIVPALDAALGVRHAEGPLNEHLKEMREYMPPQHRSFVETLEAGSSIREYIASHAGARELREAYNTCLQYLAEFRGLHLHYADRYIHSQSHRDPANPSQVGTGGTPFMPYLQKHRDETMDFLLPD